MGDNVKLYYGRIVSQILREHILGIEGIIRKCKNIEQFRLRLLRKQQDYDSTPGEEHTPRVQHQKCNRHYPLRQPRTIDEEKEKIRRI